MRLYDFLLRGFILKYILNWNNVGTWKWHVQNVIGILFECFNDDYDVIKSFH